MKQFVTIFFLWLVIASACDPCDDCGEPLAYDPTVKMEFINQDSAASLTDLIAIYADSLDTTDALVNFYNDSIANLEDSLVILDSLILLGQTDLTPTQTTFNSTISELTSDVTELNENMTILDSVSSVLDDVLTTINNGTVQLQEVKILENGSVVVFDDSASLFSFPLLMENNLTQTTFDITIDGEVFSISFEYTTFENISGDRIATIKAANIDTVFHTFDSLIITCTSSECISDEATVTAYF